MDMESFSKLLAEAERPVIIAGQGVRLAHAQAELMTFALNRQIPVVAPYLGLGNLDTDDSLYIGVIGVKGSRAGNLAMQNADLIISIGSRLSVTAIGYEYKLFAREAKKVVIDIDPVEHQKKTVAIDLFIQADAREFLSRCESRGNATTSHWLDQCQLWKEKYPVCLPEYRTYPDKVSMYHLVDELSRLMGEQAVVVSDAGSAFYVTTQAIHLHGNQRYLTSGGQADMGFTLPAAIGVSVAQGGGEVLGITGDGSVQMNLQELQTLVHYGLPVKLFVLNNNGYLSIRATQHKFFADRFIGTDSSSGVSFPNLRKIARAYGIKYARLAKSRTLSAGIKEVLAYPGPVIIEVMCRQDEPVVPTTSTRKRDDGKMESRPLEDMLPFLPRDEYRANLYVRPVEEE
jgi:acetolactate synthase-1/2/3 large subunit